MFGQECPLVVFITDIRNLVLGFLDFNCQPLPATLNPGSGVKDVMVNFRSNHGLRNFFFKCFLMIGCWGGFSPLQKHLNKTAVNSTHVTDGGTDKQAKDKKSDKQYKPFGIRDRIICQQTQEEGQFLKAATFIL